MYIAKRSGDVATVEQRIVNLSEGKQVPKDLSPATIERWLKRGVIEKVSSKEDAAPENKSFEAPESKEVKVKGKGKKSEAQE